MTDYNTMTAQQCADWLAERDGCCFSIDREIGPIGWCDKDGKLIGDHPYSLTLDAAAAALREPWYLVRVSHYGVRWSCHIERMNPACERLIVDAPDRLTAEYRAAVAARMEDDK